MNQQLIIFTRYPEPGKTKTRMIPVLGADGAALLQHQMTEFTVIKAKKILEKVTIAIYFTGGNISIMQNWLGKDLIYQEQTDGDLGDRMKSAFKDAFTKGINKVVIIGVDCPDLDSEILNEAFDALDRHDLVLGEAADGGYYLIGLRRLVPELFMDINWGSSEVLAKTKEIANNLQLKVDYLPLLNDVDRPEDLPIWERSQRISRKISNK
jgi:uncharacterized protein